uniref:Delta-like protein n=1 Tax=Strongyloides venezuelensis TaxID=75913 RepID=A0A0K0FJZ5_STRVS
MRTFVILLFFLINLLNNIHSKGILEVKFISFISKSGSPIEVNVCIKEYQTFVEDTGNCRFGSKSIILPKGYLTPEKNSNISNVLLFPFDMIWPKSHSLIIKGTILNEDGLKNNDSVIILYKQNFLHSGSSFLDVGKAENNSVSMHFFSSIRCDANYYGSDCSKICFNNVFKNEHIECGNDGQPICKEGWTGIKCDQPVCKNGCGLNGKCIAPDTCDCLSGYTGKTCEQCLPSVGCQNGYCKNKGNECICKDGWKGEFCDINTEPCHKKNKCKNDGICINGKNGSIKCECKEGFFGKYCQHEKLTCHSYPCKNGGTCVMTSDGSESKPVCDCLPSFYGKYCQSIKSEDDIKIDNLYKNEIALKEESENIKLRSINSHMELNLVNIIVIVLLLIIILFLISTRKNKILKKPSSPISRKYHAEELNPSRLEKISNYSISNDSINYGIENVYSYEPLSAMMERNRNFENIISKPQLENTAIHFSYSKNNDYEDLCSEMYCTISDQTKPKIQL